jgi:DNA processing protein
LGVAVTNPEHWLIALRAPHLGGARLIELLKQLGGIDVLMDMPREAMRRAGLQEETVNALKDFDEALLEHDLEWLSQPRCQLLTWDDERYPALLREVSSPPAALFTEGNPDVLWQPQVAVIGSRNPTAGGRDNARDFAGQLSKEGMTITSGLASGIDSIGHLAALDAGGFTVAVLGNGLGRIYPASGRELAERIAGHGALVSEFPPGTAPKRSHFPSRNRIISGLSLGVLVIEAALRSGTLITARLAGSQGREVFALPGSIHNPMAKGCHRLIREGAKLVENVGQIMEELAAVAGRLAGGLEEQLSAECDKNAGVVDTDAGGPQLAERRSEPESTSALPPWEDDPDYRKLWSCLGYDPKPVDALIGQSGLTARAVSAMLLMLELRGMVEAHPGGAYSRKKTRGHK